MLGNTSYDTTRAQRKRFLLGVAIGTGIAAKAAERGGADFLLALNAGRLRSMGAPSPACMLALRDSNRLVMEFGQEEILTNTSLPVFFGANVFDPGEDHDELIQRIANAGFRGVVNFPSAIFLDGNYRAFLENAGFGFERELALLCDARRRGLKTLAYVHTIDEARRAASAGVDIINLNVGWNKGGVVGVDDALELDDVTTLAVRFVETVRSVDARTHCLIEGGPIVTPEQMEEVCSLAKADGYIGGSTIDRMPLENAIEMMTGAFKTIGALRKQVDSLEKQLHPGIIADALLGASEAMREAREEVTRAIESDLPVLIVGPAGTGRREVAKLIHDARMSRRRWMVAAECAEDTVEEAEVQLFGAGKAADRGDRPGLLVQAHDSTLLLDDAGVLPIRVQRRILRAVNHGSFMPRGSEKPVALTARFIGISCFDPARQSDSRRFDPAFSRWLSAIRIDLPPLRERPEDLPMLVERMLRTVARAAGHAQKRKLDPFAYRTLLSHDWPDNLRELRTVLHSAVLKARSPIVTASDLPPLGKSPASALTRKPAFSSEREWILSGLKRNRYRRGATAQYLGISRKTLYNKMQRYGLSR